MKRIRATGRGRRLLAAIALGLAVLIVPAWTPPPATAGPGGCTVEAGAPAPTDIPWAQQRLDFERVQQLATGTGTIVAVIDSGLTTEHPQTSGIRTTGSRNVMGEPYTSNDLYDCEDYGHGTRVAAIIAAPTQEGVGFRGLAPGTRIMPIKYRDSDTQQVAGDSAAVARGINAAVQAGVDVINLSLVTPDTPALRAAVERAGAADIVVVAASGNDSGQGVPSRYPAAYAGEEGFDHVLAVGAIDPQDQVTGFSVTGDYLGVVAPGSDIVAPTQIQGYYAEDGTSFATPYASATAALVRQVRPELSASEVVTRLKATADRPGVSVPDAGYGWGVINPYRAITAERDDSQILPEPEEHAAVPAPNLPEPPDHTLRNLGFAVASGLLGAALLFAIGTAAWRHTAERRRQTNGGGSSV